ncbi:MAG: hypothetical protein AB9834_16930 [Lentimicrobium sp.]
MKKINFPTLIAISALSWILVNITHEFFGHAVFGIISGLKLNAISTSTAFFNIDWSSYIYQHGYRTMRLFLIGGVLMNFVTGVIAVLILRFNKSLSSQMQLFLWLFSSFSFIIIVMNFISVTLIGGGDLPQIISTFKHQETLKIIVLIIGFMILIAGYMTIQKSFLPEIKGHRSVLISITLIPVITAIIIQTLSLLKSPFAYLPPSENHLLSSVFAYFHFLLWVFIVNIIPLSGKKNPIENVGTEKSIIWVTIGLIFIVFYIFILGPGIGSFEGHSSLNG